MKLAIDPTPYHATHSFLEFPALAARLGYEQIQITPHPDFLPFYRHPRADDDFVDLTRSAARRAGVEISSLLPVQRLSWPDEPLRQAAVRNWRRIIQIAVRLGVSVINTEFSGRPERPEESETAFYRSMEELLPLIETEGLTVNFDPHPDDFVEDGLDAWRIIRGLNARHVGFVYVAAHTFHYGDRAASLIPQIGTRLGAVYLADTLDHRRSHGLRYITNPPGSPARIHQHLKIGDGDVDWSALFGALKVNGFLNRDDGILVSNVFAEDEAADVVSTHQLRKIRELAKNATETA